MSKKKTTVRWRYGKKGFSFLVDGTVNEKRLCYYTTKRALLKGTARFMGDRPCTVVDETGMSYRNNPKKK